MRYLLKDATIFRDGATFPHTNILVEGDKIAKISAERIEIAAQECNLSGYTLMPGFINTHVHLFDCFNGFQEDKWKVWLLSGFTHLRDQGILSRHTTKDAVAWRERLKPSVLHPAVSVCGKFITSVNGYGGVQPLEVATESQARDAVKRQVDEGVDHIKTTLDDGYDAYTQSLGLLPINILAAICDEAHKLGKRVSAHVNRHEQLKTLLEAGIDEAAHACFDRIAEETLEYMVAHQVYMTPTLSVYGEITTNWGAPLLYGAMDNVSRFVAAGGTIGFGNDYMSEKPIWSPVGMPFMEIELLRKAGLSMGDIITAATLGGAKILGDAYSGRIEQGCTANLIAVKGNPLELPYLLSDIHFVMKDGIVVKQQP
ncbi:MAG: amidohydrolase family protein [Eubacteriales bacterium]|nr:amidohydrolase family protein [Eubacteriales bacterium]